jgi:hypothetical protein
MTEQEFLDTVHSYGLKSEDYPTFIRVSVTSRYGRPIFLAEYIKTDYDSNLTWLKRKQGEVDFYYLQPIKSVDGYLVDYEGGDIWKTGQTQRFTKQFKFDRALKEELLKLKKYNQEIKLTEIEWDFE